MFPHLTRFNLQNWIDENRGDWGRRRVIWEDSDFIVFVTRGPNTRTDFHINPGDEIFHQLEGELNLHYLTPDDKPEVAVLKAGDMFLLPARVPHSPRREGGSWTLVTERVRTPDEDDRFVWVCSNCTHRLYETTAHFNDPADTVQKAYEDMAANESLRHCTQCGQTEAPVRSEGPAFVWKG